MPNPFPVQQCRWHAMSNTQVMATAVAERTLAAANRAVREHGRFVIVLAGGNTPRGVYELLRSSTADWSNWHVYFGDERCVPRTDLSRNSRMAESVQPMLVLERVPAQIYAATSRHRL